MGSSVVRTTVMPARAERSSLHRGAHRLPDRYARRIESVQAEHVDPEVIGRDTLAMKRINTARLAEVMPSRQRVETILRQRILSGQEPEPRFVHLDHQRVLAATDRAIAGGQFREIGRDLELDCA